MSTCLDLPEIRYETGHLRIGTNFDASLCQGDLDELEQAEGLRARAQAVRERSGIVHHSAPHEGGMFGGRSRGVTEQAEGRHRAPRGDNELEGQEGLAALGLAALLETCGTLCLEETNSADFGEILETHKD